MAGVSSPNKSFESTHSSKPSKVSYRLNGPTRTLRRSAFIPRQMKSAPQINEKANNSLKLTQGSLETCRRFRVKSFQNQLAEAERTIANLMAENRTLRTMHKRQEVSLQKYEAANTDLPKLLNSHAEEVRVWEIKCRNLQNVNKQMQERLPRKESLIYALTDQNKYFSQLNVSKHLEERQQLTTRLKELEDELEVKSKNVAQAVWRWQAELRHVKQKLTMVQKKVRSCVYDLQKSHVEDSVIDKLKAINLMVTPTKEDCSLKLASIRENPILTEISAAEDSDTQQSCETNTTRKLSSFQRRLNQQHQFIRRRVERGDGDANILPTTTSLAQQLPRDNSHISPDIIETSSVDAPLTESSPCGSEYGKNEDREKSKQNIGQIKSMTKLDVSDSQLSYIAPTTPTDGSGTEDDCQSVDFINNTIHLKREISNLRSRIKEDFSIHKDTYSRSAVMPKNFMYTDESDADVNTANINEIIDVKPTNNFITPSLRENQLLASLKSQDENNVKKNS